jgi:hypothetical protein
MGSEKGFKYGSFADPSLALMRKSNEHPSHAPNHRILPECHSRAAAFILVIIIIGVIMIGL